MSLLPDRVHPSWSEFLTPRVSDQLAAIESSLVTAYNPAKEKVLRFLTTDLDALKIVILGQDPYPEKGVATGRAFEVGGLETWDTPFRQVSLKNFIRLIYAAQKGISDYGSISTFTGIVNEIKAGRFRLADPPKLFDQLEKQGVLFLNTCFTVTPGKPLSHRELWEHFTEGLMIFLSKRRPDLFWFLWGKNAQSYRPFISDGIFYESRHPMMCSQTYDDDFLKCNCIRDTMKIVNWTGNKI